MKNPVKSSVLLREAQKLITKRQTMYICHAISYAAQDMNTPEAKRKAEVLKIHIMKSLTPYSTATAWLHHKLKLSQEIGEWHASHEHSLREWRTRWLDALIKEYEAKGD